MVVDAANCWTSSPTWPRSRRNGATPAPTTIARPREHLASYLRSLDIEREGLPSWFGEALAKAVAHDGVESLDPSPALEDALLRLFVSQQRRDEQLPIVLALLDEVAAHVGDAEDLALRESLDHLIERTRRRYPEVAAQARNVRYRVFDRPHVERSRGETSARMQSLSAALAGPDPDPLLVDELVACPLPLVPILATDDLFARTTTPGGLIEVLLRRYYKIRELAPVVHGDDGVVRTSYGRHERTVHVLATRVEDDDLGAALAAIAAAASDVAVPDTAVADLFLARPAGAPADSDALSVRLGAALASAALPELVRRVTLVASHPVAGTEVLTFRRPDESGERPFWMAEGDGGPVDPMAFEEDVTFRGLHPMIARRLQMWRLANFEIARLPAVGADVNLFDATARDNPSDERLIAVAEVRDLTPIRDESGRAVALPEVESVLVGCLDAIRRAREDRPALRRLEWNRVMLYMWPVIDLPLDEVYDIARRLTPLTEGLGLEQVVVSGRLAQPDGSEPVETVMRLGFEAGRGLNVRLTPQPDTPMQPLDDYTRKLIQTRRRGLVYPYELVPLLAGDGGSFVEHDLDDEGRLVPVDRPPGQNRAGVVVGVVSTPTAALPGGHGARGRAR